MGQTSPRREKAPSRPQAQPGMWYLSSWRDLPRRSNAGHGLLNKPEITPPSHSNHRRDGTTHNLYAVPREKSVQRFREQIRNLTRRHAPVRLSAMIAVLNPIIRGWGNYYRKANVRTLFHRLDGWIERRLFSFIARRWRNTAWRRYPTPRLGNEFGLVRLIHLVPGIRIIPRQRRRPHRKAACGKTARAV